MCLPPRLLDIETSFLTERHPSKCHYQRNFGIKHSCPWLIPPVFRTPGRKSTIGSLKRRVQVPLLCLGRRVESTPISICNLWTTANHIECGIHRLRENHTHRVFGTSLHFLPRHSGRRERSRSFSDV